MHKKVLVFSPHSDDAELGCGGYMHRAIQERNSVHVCVILIKEDTTLEGVEVPAEVRLKEFHDAGSVLGIGQKNMSVMHYVPSDPVFDLCTYPKNKVVSRMDRLIKQIQPTEILIPVPSFHQEHQYVFECGIAATRPTKNTPFLRRVLAYEYPAADYGPSSAFDASRGSVYVNITKSIEAKIKALKCYESQNMNREDRLVSVGGVRNLAALRGSQSGFKFAERFFLIRQME